MAWGEAWALTEGVLRDPDSHTLAAMRGWSYVPPAVERTTADFLEVYLNAKRTKGTVPIRVERPWTKHAAAAPSATSEEDKRQRARLDALLTPS